MPAVETYLTKPFADWLLADAMRCVADALETSIGAAAYEANARLAEKGDHWNDGRGLPSTGDPAVRRQTLDRLKAEQAPTDTANEILDNATNGLLGTEAAITFVSLAAPPANESDADRTARQAREAADSAAMLGVLSGWWDTVDLWGAARTAARRARWATRGPLRPWVPPSALVTPEGETEARLPGNRAFADALARIALSAPLAKQAHLFVHPDTLARAAVFTYTQDGDRAELWFLDADGRTVRRDLDKNTAAGGGVVGEPLDLGGRLPLSEVTGALLLTEAARHQQAALDFDGIAARVATKAAGFRARYTLNAQPTGVWTTTKPSTPPLKTETWDGETWYLVETPLLMGPGVAVQLTGEEISDTESTSTGTTVTRRSLANPGVHTEEPVASQLFTHMLEFRRGAMLRDAKQGHLALVAKGEASGVAYVQARAAFAQDLANHKGPLERALRDVLAYVIALADVMTAEGDPLKGFLDRYRVQVTARVDPGPLTPEERAQYVAEWTAGAYSLETLQARLGIEDTDAERRALERDPMARLAYVAKVAATFDVLARAGSAESAARVLRVAGVPEDIVKALEPQDTDGVVTEPREAGSSPALAA